MAVMYDSNTVLIKAFGTNNRATIGTTSSPSLGMRSTRLVTKLLIHISKFHIQLALCDKKDNILLRAHNQTLKSGLSRQATTWDNHTVEYTCINERGNVNNKVRDIAPKTPKKPIPRIIFAK